MTIPETQLAAFEEIQPDLPGKRQEVFEAIAGHHDGMTLFEITSALGWPINCVSGRVTELSRVNWIKDSGKRRTNPNYRKPSPDEI